MSREPKDYKVAYERLLKELRIAKAESWDCRRQMEGCVKESNELRQRIEDMRVALNALQVALNTLRVAFDALKRKYERQEERQLMNGGAKWLKRK